MEKVVLESRGISFVTSLKIIPKGDRLKSRLQEELLRKLKEGSVPPCSSCKHEGSLRHCVGRCLL